MSCHVEMHNGKMGHICLSFDIFHTEAAGVGVLYTELTWTEEKALQFFSLGEEAGGLFLPEDKRCAFRTVMRGSPPCRFSFESYMAHLWPLQSQRSFQNWSIFVLFLRVGKSRDSCYIFMPLSCIFV